MNVCTVPRRGLAGALMGVMLLIGGHSAHAQTSSPPPAVGEVASSSVLNWASDGEAQFRTEDEAVLLIAGGGEDV